MGLQVFPTPPEAPICWPRLINWQWKNLFFAVPPVWACGPWAESLLFTVLLWSSNLVDLVLLSLAAKCYSHGHGKPSRNCSTAAPNTCSSIKIWAACRLCRGLICQRISALALTFSFLRCWDCDSCRITGLVLAPGFGRHIPWTSWCLWCRQTRQHLPDTIRHCLFGFALTPLSGLSWFLLEMFPVIIPLTLDLK